MLKGPQYRLRIVVLLMPVKLVNEPRRGSIQNPLNMSSHSWVQSTRVFDNAGQWPQAYC